MRGENHPAAVLTEEDVRAIRRLYREGETPLHLSWAFGISTGHVGRIVRREVWRHVRA